MRRRRKHQASDSHDRWLVSYADFITLLFAFFVVMFASSNADRSRAVQMGESMRHAFERPRIASILGGTVDEKGPGNAMMKGPGGAQLAMPREVEKGILAELVPSRDVLQEELKREIDAGKMSVSLGARGLVVSVREAAFFASGEETILSQAYPSLGKVAEAIRKLPNLVRFEGHTDSVPIHNLRFRNNWELSSRRSIAMLELFTGRFNLPAERFAVAGYADTVPVAPNDREEGRARNRRVDIIILNQQGAAREPSRN